MERRFRLFFANIICTIIFVAGPGLFSLSDGAILLDKVVAVVNSEVITWSDLYKAMEFDATQTVKAMSEQERRKIFKENEAAFLENLIDMRLMLQEAKKSGIGAGDDDVNKTIAAVRGKYGMTEAALKDAIAKEGFTMEEYKKKVAEQIIINRLIDREVRSRIVVTDAEVNTIIEKDKKAAAADEGYKVSWIFIKNAEDPGQAEQRAREIYQKVKAGENFSDAARKYSEDASAKAGGDMGFVKKSDLSGEFLNMLSKLKPGDVSEPFATGKGMNIIRLESQRLYKTPEELKQAVREKLMMSKYEKDYKAWMKGLRQRAYVEVR